MQEPSEIFKRSLMQQQGKKAIYWKNNVIGMVTIKRIRFHQDGIAIDMSSLHVPGLDKTPWQWSVDERWSIVSVGPKMIHAGGAANWIIFFDTGVRYDVAAIAAYLSAMTASNKREKALRRYLDSSRRENGARPVFWPDAIRALCGEPVFDGADQYPGR